MAPAPKRPPAPPAKIAKPKPAPVKAAAPKPVAAKPRITKAPAAKAAPSKATLAKAAAGEAAVEKLRKLILDSLDDDKAEGVVALDLRGKSSIADWLVIASGRSARQVGAIADHLADRLKQAYHRTFNIEGKRGGEWVLIDAGDIIVHLFQPEVRQTYNLEKMWSADFPETPEEPAS
jgi:ribosome-associated protein